MPPRLNHRKTRTGCKRCKARKVKCDEAKPRCSACIRHDVSCEYILATPRRLESSASPEPHRTEYPAGRVSPSDDRDVAFDARLEVRLMHEWTAYTCETFSTAWQFWRYQAPLIGMEYRCVLDAMFALAALNASRQSPSQWIPMEGRMVPIRDPVYISAEAEANRNVGNHWGTGDAGPELSSSLSNSGNMAFLNAKRSHDMLRNSRIYFDRAIDGHRQGLDSLNVRNVEAVYITSILVSFVALFTLSEDESDTTLPRTDPILWLRLADGTRILCERWATFVGEEWIRAAGVFYGSQNLADEEALFKTEHGAPFEKILTWAEDYEAMTPTDTDCYEKALGYIALTFKGIFKGTDHPLTSCRRLVALPSRLPKRFTELIHHRSPRALVLLAHAFACMKLIADKVPWFEGIAEQQIPRISQQLPAGWKEIMKWPSMVSDGEFDLKGNKADIRDILLL